MAFRIPKDPQGDLRRFGRRCALGLGAFVVLGAVVGRKRDDVSHSATAGCGKSRSTNVGPIIWSEDVELVATASLMQKKRIIVWIDADWDTGMVELERQTFSDPDVRAVINDRYVALFVNGEDDDTQPSRMKLHERFKPVGVPTIILFTPNFEKEFVRINSFVTAEHLLPLLIQDSETELARR